MIYPELFRTVLLAVGFKNSGYSGRGAFLNNKVVPFMMNKKKGTFLFTSILLTCYLKEKHRERAFAPCHRAYIE